MNIFHRIYGYLVVKFCLFFNTHSLLAKVIIRDIEEHSRGQLRTLESVVEHYSPITGGISWRLGGISVKVDFVF